MLPIRDPILGDDVAHILGDEVANWDGAPGPQTEAFRARVHVFRV